MVFKKRLGEFPYTYVRSNVMRSLLLKKEEYHKLMKMSLVEITKYLQDSQYKKEIDELANQFSGIDLLEHAINKNITNSFNKLKKISPPELRIVIFIYLKRIDIDNLIKIIRGKYADEPEDRILSELSPAGILSCGFLEHLIKKDTIESVLRNQRIVECKYLEEGIEQLKQKGNLIKIESDLDKYYFKEVMQYTKELPVEGDVFRDFLELEMEVKDIMTALMLKREGIDNKEIKENLITPGFRHLDVKTIKKMLIEKELEGMINVLEKSPYSSFIEEGIKKFKDDNTLVYIEKDLNIYTLKKSLIFTHQNPLSIQNILGFMFAKEVESKNLKKIIKGKQLGVDEKFVESMIVI